MSLRGDQLARRKTSIWPRGLHFKQTAGTLRKRTIKNNDLQELPKGDLGMQLLSLIAGLPLKVRRRLLRIGWRASLLSQRDAGFGLEPLLEKYLRIGSDDARRFALEHEFHDLMQIMEWFASGRRSKRGLIADSRFMYVADQAIAERLAESGDNIILAPLHMGIFPLGISFVIFKYFAGRRVLVLRAREDQEENNVAMERLREIASEVYILNTRNEADFMEAMRFARKGAIVISMIDLPESYGSPVDTPLFGHTASIALGLDAMARMLKAVVLPMAVRSDPTGDTIIFGQPFEVWRNSEDDRGALASRIGRQIEAFVTLDPPQWHMWTRVLEFFPRTGSSRAGGIPEYSNERTAGDAIA